FAEAGARPPTTVEAARTTDLLLAGMVQRLEVVRVRERGVIAAASEQKTGFLSRMSHELRTPLNAIVGFAQLLELDAETPEAREAVEQILLAGRGMVALVEEILDIGRIEAGGLQLDLQPVPLGPAVAAALAMLVPASTARSLVVHDLVGPDGPVVLADPDRLRQVLLNLVSNAVKYNVEAGRIEVSVTRTPDAVRLAVTDTGSGLTPAEVSRLFVPFDRLGAPARGIAGTGLGLVVTRTLVEAMGGQLEVESRTGEGSTFTLALPHAPS
ncbi:MAG TPA: HAMP domain-containing sensor histidine kinase, partial [Actinomycetales bacterium]